MGGYWYIELMAYFTSSAEDITGVSYIIRSVEADNSQVGRSGVLNTTYISVRCVKD
jgi:hypothetical protein